MSLPNIFPTLNIFLLQMNLDYNVTALPNIGEDLSSGEDLPSSMAKFGLPDIEVSFEGYGDPVIVTYMKKNIQTDNETYTPE